MPSCATGPGGGGQCGGRGPESANVQRAARPASEVPGHADRRRHGRRCVLQRGGAMLPSVGPPASLTSTLLGMREHTANVVPDAQGRYVLWLSQQRAQCKARPGVHDIMFPRDGLISMQTTRMSLVASTSAGRGQGGGADASRGHRLPDCQRRRGHGQPRPQHAQPRAVRPLIPCTEQRSVPLRFEALCPRRGSQCQRVGKHQQALGAGTGDVCTLSVQKRQVTLSPTHCAGVPRSLTRCSTSMSRASSPPSRPSTL